jgi:hypothetical protein
MQRLKTQIQKLKYTITSKDKQGGQVEEDDFEARLRSEKQKTKEEMQDDLMRFKINSFITLWFHYITSHHVENLMRKSYQSGQIKGLIDIKPNIIDSLPLNSVIEHILNPRISSTDLMKRFVNQERVLENVTTYYFENLLSLAERSIVSIEL